MFLSVDPTKQAKNAYFHPQNVQKPIFLGCFQCFLCALGVFFDVFWSFLHKYSLI